MTMRRFRRQRRRPAPTTDRRSPEQRLEAMISEKNEDRRWRMFSRIHYDLDSTQDIGPWMNGLSTLRDRLLISEDETYYLAATLAESALYGAQRDPDLDRMSDELKAIEAANGLSEDEGYDVDDAPDDWRALNTAWEARADEVMADWMRKAGMGDIATAFLEEPAKFEDRASAGRQRLFPDPIEDPSSDR